METRSASQAAARGANPLAAAGPRYGERAVFFALAACAAISVVTTAAIVISLLAPTIEFFGEVPLGDFFAAGTWAPTASGENAGFGVLNLVAGTFSTTLWGMLFAVPVGLASAIYLSEYAPPRVRKVIKPVIEVLAGIPTVAIGVFAVSFLSPQISGLFPEAVKTPPFIALAGGLGIGLLLVPIIASISDDAMRAVPGGLREGAYALGSTRLKVSTRVVFPAAISGIVASIVLAASRAVGETMVVLLAAGNSPKVSLNPFEAVQTMTAFIATTATGDIGTGTITYKTIFAVGALLFVMTLVMNMFAIRLVRRFREVYE